MKLRDFKLERYFAQYEFTTKYLLSNSDCDGYAQKDVLSCASEKELSLWDNLKLGYTESEGNTNLRESICQFYNNVSIENIVVASPGELNFITMNVLLEPKDHVISIAPAYQSLHEVVKSIGCEISCWQPGPRNWNFDIDDLEKLVRKNTKLIIINFPHNPTGSYLTKEELNRVVNIARKNDIYIFSDEMYHKLIVSNMEELPPISNLYEKGISLWGTSKSFGMAGLRTGWIVAQDKDIIKKILSFKDYLTICNSAPSEILTLIALNHHEKFIIPNIQKIKRNINVFKSFALIHNNMIEFIPPKAGSSGFVKLNIKESTLDFCLKLVENTGIMALPSEMFEYEGKYLRIGFGRKNMQEVLDKFEKYIIRYY